LGGGKGVYQVKKQKNVINPRSVPDRDGKTGARNQKAAQTLGKIRIHERIIWGKVQNS